MILRTGGGHHHRARSLRGGDVFGGTGDGGQLIAINHAIKQSSNHQSAISNQQSAISNQQSAISNQQSAIKQESVFITEEQGRTIKCTE
jgi:hypothetical protein